MAKSDPRTGGTFANAHEAIRLYRQAVKVDPKFALAYVDIARAYLRWSCSNPGAAPDAKIVPPVRDAPRRSLSPSS